MKSKTTKIKLKKDLGKKELPTFYSSGVTCHWDVTSPIIRSLDSYSQVGYRVQVFQNPSVLIE